MKSRAYLRWVAGQRCCACGAFPPNEAHHIKGVGHMSGAGMRATDFATMPLCRTCHAAEHAHPTERQIAWAFATLDAAVRDGCITINGQEMP